MNIELIILGVAILLIANIIYMISLGMSVRHQSRKTRNLIRQVEEDITVDICQLNTTTADNIETAHKSLMANINRAEEKIEALKPKKKATKKTTKSKK